MSHITTRLPLPKNTMANVIHLILNKGSVSERDTNCNSFRDIISVLKNRYELPIKFKERKFVNQFKHKGIYREHYLLKRDYAKAIKLYNQINGK